MVHGVIHYHGLPVTPAAAALAAVRGGHAFVSFAHADQLNIAVEVCQSFALDNGAFSAWRSGNPITDWTPYYEWVADIGRHPHCDFAVIPDVIGGTDADNDALLNKWPHYKIGAPVWHLNSSLVRLQWLARTYPRVCLGSAGEFAAVGDARWWTRMAEVMRAVCDADGYPMTKLHGLRMLNPDVFSRLPLASADSTNIGRNVGLDSHWRGSYSPPNKETRAAVMRARIESINAPARWVPQPVQESLCLL
jgi:hypothetical protein